MRDRHRNTTIRHRLNNHSVKQSKFQATNNVPHFNYAQHQRLLSIADPLLDLQQCKVE
jgi:hypothetical protein